MAKVDNVNHPKHYAENCSLECIESMIIAFGVKDTMKYCVTNAYKYVWRCESKNGIEDLEKAKWYLLRFFDMLHDWDVERCKSIKKYNEKAEFLFEDVIPKLEEKIKSGLQN